MLQVKHIHMIPCDTLEHNVPTFHSDFALGTTINWRPECWFPGFGHSDKLQFTGRVGSATLENPRFSGANLYPTCKDIRYVVVNGEVSRGTALAPDWRAWQSRPDCNYSRTSTRRSVKEDQA
jgi:hypothetical protein